MGALSDWYKDTSIPPPKKDREEREKSGEATRCMRYVDFLVYCFGARNQGRHLYENGKFKGCGEEWEGVKWCMRAQFGDTRSRQRLIERSRQTNHHLDALPWQFKQQYIQYMFDEDRLPARMAIQVVLEQHARQEQKEREAAETAE